MRDLASNPIFNFLVAIGIEENSFLPSVSLSEFTSLKAVGPVTWKAICVLLTEKYKKLAALDTEKNSVNNQFVNRLSKHFENEEKSILIYSGHWQFSGREFAQSLLPSTKLSIYTLFIAHPSPTAPTSKKSILSSRVASLTRISPLVSFSLPLSV